MSNAKKATGVAAAPATPRSLASAKKAHRQIQHTVRVPMAADLVDEIKILEQQALREKAIDARENRDPVAPQIANQIRELEAQAADSEEAFTFRSIGRKAYNELLAEHPPTSQQSAEAKEEDGIVLSWNPDTFPPALLAASCVSHDGDVEEWTDIWETWSVGQTSQLWSACMIANAGSADAGPKSQIASEILREFEQSSNTARR